MGIKLSTRIQFNFYRFVEHFTKLKLDSSFLQNKILADLRTGSKGRKVQIERVKNITLKDFKKNYLHKGIPVVLEGFAKEWGCTKEWSLDSLARRYGEDELVLVDENTSNGEYKLSNTTLSEVLDAMRTGDKSKYSRFNRLLYDHPELVEDFDLSWMKMARNKFSSGETFQVFLGAKNSQTKIHAASEHNLFTQVVGQKHWYLISPKYDPVLRPLNLRAPYFHTDFDPAKPDYEKYPAAEFIDIYECLLNPGDVLFNPPSYWHQIDNPSASIGVGFRWFSLYDSLKLNSAQTFLTFFSLNPTIFTATKYRTNFIKIFENLHKKRK
jgi:hypothetical protein